MKILDDQIRYLSGLFKGRLDDGLVDYIASFIDHGEFAIAVETLTSHIWENDIWISESEHALICELETRLCITAAHRRGDDLEARLVASSTES